MNEGHPLRRQAWQLQTHCPSRHSQPSGHEQLQFTQQLVIVFLLELM
jgi:hypothetical protein